MYLLTELECCQKQLCISCSKRKKKTSLLGWKFFRMHSHLCKKCKLHPVVMQNPRIICLREEYHTSQTIPFQIMFQKKIYTLKFALYQVRNHFICIIKFGEFGYIEYDDMVGVREKRENSLTPTMSSNQKKWVQMVYMKETRNGLCLILNN